MGCSSTTVVNGLVQTMRLVIARFADLGFFEDIFDLTDGHMNQVHEICVGLGHTDLLSSSYLALIYCAWTPLHLGFHDISLVGSNASLVNQVVTGGRGYSEVPTEHGIYAREVGFLRPYFSRLTFYLITFVWSGLLVSTKDVVSTLVVESFVSCVMSISFV